MVTRKRGGGAEMISLAGRRAMQETLHLTSSPANAARLAAAISQLEAGGGAALAPFSDFAGTPRRAGGDRVS
jgi:antitoxin YefM